MTVVIFLPVSENAWLANPSFSVEVSQIPLPGEQEEQTVAPDISIATKQSEPTEHHKGRKTSSHKKLKCYHKQSR
jgi:hypothetical protein